MSWTDTAGEKHEYPRNEEGFLNAVADIKLAIEAGQPLSKDAESILYEAKALGYAPDFVTNI